MTFLRKMFGTSCPICKCINKHAKWCYYEKKPKKTQVAYIKPPRKSLKQCAICEYNKHARNIETIEIEGKKYDICKECKPKFEKAKKLLEKQ